MKLEKNNDLFIENLYDKLGGHIRLAVPLGIGKPNHFLNTLYSYTKRHPHLKLTIYTALSLSKPKGDHFLEKRFIDLFSKRIFGNYVELLYEKERLEDKLPSNIEVVEFYFAPGKYLKNNKAQKNYISSNYTHVYRDLADKKINLIATMAAKEEGDFSFSSNADVTDDLICELKHRGDNFRFVVQVNRNLPFMYGEGVIDKEKIDYLLDDDSDDFDLFSPPKLSISDQDYMIGLYASSLVKDDGELQVGIGSLGDSVVYALIKRHLFNSEYKELMNKLSLRDKFKEVYQKLVDLNSFEVGLFGATEMMVDGFMELYKANILKKKVYDHVEIQTLINEGRLNPNALKLEDIKALAKRKVIRLPLNESDFKFLRYWGFINHKYDYDSKVDYCDEKFLGEKLNHGHLMHAGFFLGPKGFYRWLRDLKKEQRELFDMRSVLKINQLFGAEPINRLHRKNARFINTCMMTTLMGAHVSDATEEGAVVSGVGGQFNFVSQAQELPDGHSIIMMRSVRTSRGELSSNIIDHYGHITVPRHMRDILVTEYGVAYLRGKTDRDIVIELLRVCDSRFQNELLLKAKLWGKIEKEYTIPPAYQKNVPQSYMLVLNEFKKRGWFESFPFGTDLNSDEIALGAALKKLSSLKNRGLISLVFSLFKALFLKKSKNTIRLLSLMHLQEKNNLQEKIAALLLGYYLEQ